MDLLLIRPRLKTRPSKITLVLAPHTGYTARIGQKREMKMFMAPKGYDKINVYDCDEINVYEEKADKLRDEIQDLKDSKQEDNDVPRRS